MKGDMYFESCGLKLKMHVCSPLNLAVLILPCRTLELESLLNIERDTRFGTDQKGK